MTRNSDSANVMVWDLPTRAFHWSVVALVFLSWLSADQGWMKVHLISGLTLLTLLVFRIGWGFFGSTTARFSNFVHPPRRILGYLKGLAGRDTPPYAGHNPVGGLMVVTMIAALLTQVATGLFANDGLEFNAPLALLISTDASTRLTEIHGLIFDLILCLIWFHLVAIGFYLFVRRRNLIYPMLTGRKATNEVPEGVRLRFVGWSVALLVLSVSAGITAWIVFTR
jgi:cytochrome b